MPHTKKDKHNPTFPQALAAGVTAGTAEIASVGHPLWVIKTRMQLGDPKPFALKGMYHGLGGNIATMMPLVALRLGTATAFKNACFKQEYQSPYQPFVSGLAGGAITYAFGSPLEYARTIQLNNKRKKNINQRLSSTIWDNIKRNGVTSLYRGATSTMIRDSFHTCGFFALAPSIRKKIEPHIKNDNVTLAISGPIAGTVTAVTSQPFDAIRIHQQMSTKDKSHPISMNKATQEIVAEKGLQGFFAGSAARTARVILGVGIIATIDNKVQRLFEEKTEMSRNKLGG